MASKTLDPIDILLELGIDLDDLSEQDYLSALKEAIATIEFRTGGRGDERSAALREEVIKLRRPKVKRTKISADSFKKGTAIGGNKGGGLVVRPSSSLVPASLKPEEDEEGVEVKEKEQKDSVVKILSDISKTVKSILVTLKKKTKSDKDLARQNRLAAEREKRALAEKNLEKRFTGLKNFAQKMLKPIMGPFEALMNFIKNIILGKIVLGIIDWFADPENQQKVQSFIRFLKDWWPALITAVLLFATPLGGIIAGIVSTLTVATGKLLTVLPKLLAFLKSPLVVGLGLFAATGAGIYATGKMLGKDEVVENETERADTSREALEEAESTKDLSAGDREALVQGTRLKDAGGGGSLNNMPDQFNDPLGLRNDPLGMGGMRLNQGGQVPGSGNKDTVPAMLTPGEFVIKREAVKKYGVDTLTSMNSMTKSLPSYEGGGVVDEREFDEKGESYITVREPLDKEMSSLPGMSGGGGGTNALTNQAKVRTVGAVLSDLFGAFKRKEIDPQTILEEVESRAKSLISPMGEVKESSGQDLSGATADRQLVKVQPGEYILPVDTVTALGGPAALDKIVAQTDSNSTPAKLGMRSERMIPNAPMRSGPVINVVPMEAPSGAKEAIDPSGSILPNFSAGTGSALKARSLGVVR
jgi:hypothetical protein